MKDEYIIINKTAIQKEKEELKKLINKHVGYGEQEIYDKIDELCSQSTPLIPDIKDIQIWLSKQSYQKEYGEQEYMMYYDVDIPKIIQDYITNLKLDI